MADLDDIVRRARREANAWTAPDLARLIGCSVRTVYRRVHGEGLLYPDEHEALLRAVHPRNPALAAEYAAALGADLERMGLEKRIGPDDAALVLHAAADAADVAPSVARKALAAAIAKAAERDIPLEALRPLLVPARKR